VLLRKAGFERVEMRSVRDHTAGFKVRKAFGEPDAVEIHWWPSSLDHSRAADREKLWLGRYADAIAAAGRGWQVDRRRPDKLVIRARKVQSDV
jgi:hypothetical protein